MSSVQLKQILKHEPLSLKGSTFKTAFRQQMTLDGDIYVVETTEWPTQFLQVIFYSIQGIQQAEVIC